MGWDGFRGKSILVRHLKYTAKPSSPAIAKEQALYKPGGIQTES